MAYMITIFSQGQYNSGDFRHPVKVMRDLGIDYRLSVSQSIADCWQFLGVNKDAEVPYDWMSLCEFSPSSMIGFGISESDAESLDR